MNSEDKIKKWIDDNGCPEYCDYCIWNHDCPKGMVCYGGEPIEPPCCRYDDAAEFLDTDEILKDLEEELEV